LPTRPARKANAVILNDRRALKKRRLQQLQQANQKTLSGCLAAFRQLH